jgi:[ribosomal protein S18]-alanine N-acetyltransferase
MTLTLRYMRLADISQVVNIDRVSFDTPWSARSYSYEIEESQYSHMVSLEYETTKSVNGWRRWMRGLRGGTLTSTERTIVAYGGLWNIMDEAHISTIATHPDWRGRGWGEIVLAAMVRRAISLNAGYIVLEVRVSNHVAKTLYEKYEFVVHDVKPNYYRHNNEDAYDMRLMLGDMAMYQRFEVRWQNLIARHQFLDYYTNSQPVRK